MPLALAIHSPHGPVIHALNRAAAAAGARRGARASDLRALCPTLPIAEAEPARDAALLARLAFWTRRWGPFAGPDGPDGLVLDVTGAAHLRGGEAPLLEEIEATFARAGLTARPAIAPGRGAAWALARFGPPRAICHDPGPALAPLPVAALRLSPETLLLLHRLGLGTIGQLAALPRAALMRRFARGATPDNPLIRLDQAMGRLAEPLDAPEPAPRFLAEASLAEPVMDPSDWLPALVEQLCAQLAAEGRGCRQLCLSVFRVDGERREIRVGLAAPSHRPDHMLRLLASRVERLDPGHGFDLIRLAAEAVEPLAPAQDGLDGRAGSGGPGLALLVDRLVARFGAAAVSEPRPAHSHLPERSQVAAPPLAPDPPALCPARPDRPLRLLSPPEPIRVLYALPDGPPARFLWRRQTLQITRHAGPERIAPEWWHDRPGTRLRDYFRVEDETGLRLWIYREGLAGDGRGGPPRWFLHGIFA